MSSVSPFSQGILTLKSTATPTELEQAEAVKEIHDRIEVVAYSAFVEKVKELGIRGNKIPEEASVEILKHIKIKAHREMFKEGGYMKERGKMLGPNQIKHLSTQVGKIIHDRDTKLTNAQYSTVSDMLLALDDHNTMVKEILLRSWCMCPEFEDSTHAHLDRIKREVNFYPELNAQLGFDLETSLKTSKKILDTFFPGLRKSEDSIQFVNMMKVRSQFKDMSLMSYNPNMPVIEAFKGADVQAFFVEQTIANPITGKTDLFPPILNREMTVGELIQQYLPEMPIRNYFGNQFVAFETGPFGEPALITCFEHLGLISYSANLDDKLFDIFDDERIRTDLFETMGLDTEMTVRHFLTTFFPEIEIK